jgi:hypothetical protein
MKQLSMLASSHMFLMRVERLVPQGGTPLSRHGPSMHHTCTPPHARGINQINIIANGRDSREASRYDACMLSLKQRMSAQSSKSQSSRIFGRSISLPLKAVGPRAHNGIYTTIASKPRYPAPQWQTRHDVKCAAGRSDARLIPRGIFLPSMAMSSQLRTPSHSLLAPQIKYVDLSNPD